MAACERSEKKTLAPGSHVHALARSALFSWLTATKVSHGGDSAICAGDVPEESVIAKEVRDFFNVIGCCRPAVTDFGYRWFCLMAIGQPRPIR